MTLRRWADRGGSSSRSSRVALGFAWLAIVLVAASLLPHSAAAQGKSTHRTPRRARPGGRERLDRKCERRYGCDGGIVQDVPHDITHAAAEVRLEDGSIADVVLFRGTDAAVAVEILVTHAVGSQKAERLSVPWMELLAVDVLDRPYWWLVSQDGLQPFPCPACAKRDESATRALSEIQGRALAIAKRLGLRLPASPPYYSVAHDCWRCGSGMVAFVWPGGGGHGDRRPPAPIPASVQHRATDAGDYSANCCPSCSAVQGDHYLSHDNADYVSALALSQEVAG